MSQSWEFELPMVGQTDSRAADGEPSPTEPGPAPTEPSAPPTASPQAPSASTWESLNGREQAAALLEAGRAQEALMLLQPWMDKHPEDVTGWCLVSRGLLFLKEDRQSLRAAECALEADPYSAEGYVWKCRLMLHHGWTRDAVEVAESGLEMTYQDPALRQWQIRSLLAVRRQTEALGILNAEPPRELDAAWAVVHGECALDVGDLPNADLAFQHAYRLNPRSVPAVLGMAAVFMARGQDAQAVACLHHAVHLSPADPEPARCVVEMLDALEEREARPGSAGAAALGLIIPQIGFWMMVGEQLRRQSAKGYVRSVLTPELMGYYRWHKRQNRLRTEDGCSVLFTKVLLPLAAVLACAVVAWSYGWEAGARLAVLAAIARVAIRLGSEQLRKEPPPAFHFRFPGEEPPVSSQPDAEEAADAGAMLRQRVWNLLDQGELEQAREAARERIRLDVGNADAQVQYAMTLLVTDRVKEGLMAARRARSWAPDDARGHALVWAGLAMKGALEAAVKEAETAPECQQGAERMLGWLVRKLYRSPAPKSGRAVAGLIERIYPGSGLPYQVEADRLMKKSLWKKAETAYLQGLTVEPDSAELRAGLSWSLGARYRYVAAVKEARQALNLDPREVSGQNSLLRHLQLILAVAPMVVGGVAALAASIPTLMGAGTNWWIVGVSAGVPGLCGLLAGLLAHPVARKLAPGLMMRSDLACATFRDSLRYYSVLGWTVSSAACLSVHTLQCWLEILLHRNTLTLRWPGAATVTIAALFAGWLAWKRLSFFRWRDWWNLTH